MLRSHFTHAGEGKGIGLTAVLEGIRPARLDAPALLVRGRTEASRVGVVLLADPLIILVIGGSRRVMQWSLLPGGPSVTARADGLRFLRGLATGGDLSFLGDGLRLPPIEFEGGPWNDEDEWRLFEDLAVIEEWGGVTLPMPELVTGHDATIAAQAAGWARTKTVEARLSDVITFSARSGGNDLPDELRLHQMFSLELMAQRISMGNGVARVELRAIEREDEDGGPRDAIHYVARPATLDVTFLLTPPLTRRVPPRRTQPDQISPPRGLPSSERPPPQLSERRPAVRRLSAVLVNRRKHRIEHPGGTAALLDDLRG
jgi:hypothetical protein